MPTESCLFCRIVRGEAPASIIHRDEQIVAFHDLRPVAPMHILIIPTKHLSSLRDMQEEDEKLMGKMMTVARELAIREGIDMGGYRLVVNTGPEAGQSILHLHLHLLGGRRMQWPPG